jgi:hypothetical protein
MTIPLEKQVTSLELSKKLRDLGVKQESLFYWWPSKSVFVQTRKPEGTVAWCSAFTVAELGEMFNRSGIGDFHSTLLGADGWFCSANTKRGEHHKTAATEADARAATLVYLLENHLLTP